MESAERHRENCNLAAMVAGVRMYIEHRVSVEELKELKAMLLLVELPEIGADSELYEAKLRLDYLDLLEELDERICFA